MSGYIFYGTESNAKEVREFTEHILKANEIAEARAMKKTPVCIWGTHGIGKTELVQQLAAENGYEFVYIAPAQFEEMGDLVGMPSIQDGRTVFRSPEWVPMHETKGILLIDDVNRADDRILRGVMQLLQNYELVSWKLPKGWQIILTANPDGGDYSVTPMDDAMLTRMMHVTMKFDVKTWAYWAEKSAVDPRGINFVLTYPEVAQGKRTTPRTLVQFFDSIRNIEDLQEHLALVQMLAASCLDDETVTAFIVWVQQRLSQLINPEEIIAAKDFKMQVYNTIKSVVSQDVFRVDIMATLCTRLANYLLLTKDKITPEGIKNIQEFIKMDFIPNDLRLALLQDIVQASNNQLKLIMADAEISKLLLKKM